MTSTRTMSTLVLLAGAVLTAPQAAAAQNSGFTVGGGFAHESYRFRDFDALGTRRISLATFPFVARYSGRVIVEISGAFAQGELDPPFGEGSSISGLTDTGVRLAVPLLNERVTLSGTAYLPTGKATQTEEESIAAGAIAADLLPFRITNWGTGGGFDVSASFAVPMGGFGFGARVGYAVGREFEPLEDAPSQPQFKYQPGDQLYGRVAIDRALGPSAKFSVSATIQRFSDDSFNGTNLFRSGDRLQVLGTLNFAAGANGTGVFYGGVLHRSESEFLDGEFFDSSLNFPSQDLILAGGGFRLPLGTGAVLPSTDLRVFRSADGVGQGYALGFGTSAEIPFTGGTFIPTVRARVGNVVVNDDVRSGFVGSELGIMFRFGGR
jgi:hypothetical protein